MYNIGFLFFTLGNRNNRYGLVGYGEDGVDSHTMEGKIFNDADKFAMGLENLKFTNDGGPYINSLKAISYASILPFRTGVKKTVILVR